jgi:hypothetical protein
MFQLILALSKQIILADVLESTDQKRSSQMNSIQGHSSVIHEYDERIMFYSPRLGKISHAEMEEYIDASLFIPHIFQVCLYNLQNVPSDNRIQFKNTSHSFWLLQSGVILSLSFYDLKYVER